MDQIQAVQIANLACFSSWDPLHAQGDGEGATASPPAVDSLLGRVGDAGFPSERVVLLGFSQGACLGLEYAARHARRYAGVVGLSGGLIGPDGRPRDYPGSLAGTQVFLGCSDIDRHIPLARVRETTAVLRRLGGVVTERIYSGMGHGINEDEIGFVRGLLAAVVQEPSRPGSATT